jgi:hypothetical protein
MPDQDKQAVYVYGVIRGGEAVEITTEGIEGAGRARLLRHDGMAALVADVSPDPEVLAEGARHTTVLPMRFGVVFPDERRIVDEFLGPSGGELASLLDRFEGMVEATLRGVFEDEDARLREVVEQEPEIARLRDQVREVPEDAGYYARIRLGELVASALEARRAAEERRILDRLQPLAHAVDRDTELAERVVVKAAFLIERPKLQAFDREVDALARELAGRIRFTYAGPLALHSFVDLTPMGEPVPAQRS